MHQESQACHCSFVKHSFLAVLLGLLVCNIYLLPRLMATEYPYPYVNLTVSLMLVLNHIAFNYTEKGLASKVMKTVASVWLALGAAYILWASAHTFGGS